MATFLECLENKKLRFPKDAWKKKENHLLFLKYLGEKEGYKTKEDWYKMTRSKIIKYRGSGILHFYGSIKKILNFKDPNYDWKPWLFSSVPNNYWKDKANHKLFFNWLGQELGYRLSEDWYDISRDKVAKMGGDGLLNRYYNHSAQKFVKVMLPEYDFKLFLFKSSEKGIWSSSANKKEYMEWLREKKDLKNIKDLYKLTYDMVDKNNGTTLLTHYKWSIQKLIKDIYPEYDWKPWLFSCVPQNYWKDKANHKLFFNWLGEELGYTKPEDWYLIEARVIKKNNGGGLLGDYYNDSPVLFVKSMLPDYEWLEWKFNAVPHHYWNDRKNRLNYMEWFKKQRNYTKPEDWYTSSHTDFISTILVVFKSASHILLIMDTYPEYDWDIKKFRNYGYSKGQLEWLNYLLVETPDIRHILNHPDGEYIIPNTKYKADGFSEKEKTVFEFDGDAYHGNPKLFDLNQKSFFSDKTYGELYNNTLKRKEEIKELGLKVVSVWEMDWKRGKKALIKLQRIFKKNLLNSQSLTNTNSD